MDLATILLISGTLILILITILSGVVQAILFKRIESNNENIEAIDSELSFIKERENSAVRNFQTAQLKLAIIQAGQMERDISFQHMSEYADLILNGVVDRSCAATGIHPSEEQFEKWNDLARRLEYMDTGAYKDLMGTAEYFQRDWATKYNHLVAQSNKLNKRQKKVQNSIDFIRYLTTSLQITALIVLLLKDLFGN